MSNPLKHHYVPQCYLKKFSSDNVMANFYDKDMNKFDSKEIRNFCQIENLYKLSETDPYYIETTFFAKNYENKLGKILQFFEDLNYSTSEIKFDINQRMNLSKQIILQYIRHPKYRTVCSQYELNAFYEQVIQLCKILNYDVEEIEYKPDNIAEYHKTLLLENSNWEANNKTLRAIAEADWELIYTCEEEFYTSDNPIAINPRKDMPVTYCDAITYFSEIFYPLNPKIVLYIKAQKPKSNKTICIHKAEAKEILAINKLISKNAIQYIIYRTKFNNYING